LHEYAIIEEVLEAIMQRVVAEGASGVKRIVLRVGRLSGYSPESLQQAHDVLKRGTPAESSSLVIRLDDGDSVILEQVVIEA
jgi:Zn finger protein HypA/HybF involved in hydrogenase expression